MEEIAPGCRVRPLVVTYVELRVTQTLPGDLEGTPGQGPVDVTERLGACSPIATSPIQFTQCSPPSALCTYTCVDVKLVSI
jgi:hypothetical protein